MYDNLDDLLDDDLMSDDVGFEGNIEDGSHEDDLESDDYDYNAIVTSLSNKPGGASGDDDSDEDNEEDEDEEEGGSEDDDDSNEGGDDEGTEADPITESTAINELLKLKGIDDPKAVKYEDEDGNIVDVDFYELPYEEQMEILKSSDTDIDFGLDDSEVSTINFLRRNNVTLEDVVEYYKRQAIEEYVRENSTAEFKVDDYTDEELFVLDLKAKYDSLTEDELKLELEKEVNHPDLFKKKIEKIRDEYKRLEEEERTETENAKIEEENGKFEELKGSLITVATELEDIGGIDIEVEDKNEILEFILLKDVNGKSNLDKLMGDPNKLFELAWYAVKGKEAFDFVHSYYKKEIENVRKATYDKAKEDLGKVKQVIPKKNAIKPAGQIANRKNVKSMDDLYD